MRSAAERLRLAVLLLAACLPYLNALGNDFTFDDRAMILENPAVQRHDPPVATVFTEPFYPGALYRPMTFMTFWANHRLHGLTPFGFHLVNLVLHAIASLLVYRLLQSMRLGAGITFIAALVFAVHPIHTEAVTSIVGRAELLSTLAVLGALLFAARSRRVGAKRGAWLTAAALLFAFGLLCKENAFVFLPLLVLAAATAERRAFRPVLVELNASGELPLFAAIGLAYLLLRWALFGTLTVGETIAWIDNPLAQSSTATRLATATVVLVDALTQMLLPITLSADYSYRQITPVESLSDPRLLVALAFIVTAAALAWSLRAKAPAVLAGLLFFALAISLTSNLLFPIGTIRGERLLYLPSVGFCLALAAAAAWVVHRWRDWGAVAVALVLLAYAGRTWARNLDWASDTALFAATLETSPHSAKVHHNLGVLAADAKRYDEAAMHFRRALQLYPTYQDAAFGIAKMYQDRGMMVGAMRWYGETLKMDPTYVKAHMNSGVIMFNAGELEAAERSFMQGLLVRRTFPGLLTGLGFVRLAEGRVEEARRAFEEAREISPDDADVRRGLELAAERAQRAQGS